MILLTKIKNLEVGTGAQRKDRKSTRDKANISNPKVNRGCAPLTANRTSDCVQISLRPSIPYIPLGVYNTGRFNAMEGIRLPDQPKDLRYIWLDLNTAVLTIYGMLQIYNRGVLPDK